MSIEAQKEILKRKRLQRDLSPNSICPRYQKFEAGELSFKRSRISTLLPIIKALDLTKEEMCCILDII